ncbi:MAG: hypothetical protein AAB610_00025 [Patescibacteria group bacterium]
MTISRNLEQFSAQDALGLFRSTHVALQQSNLSDSEITELESVKVAAVARIKAACAGAPNDLTYFRSQVHHMDYRAWPKA